MDPAERVARARAIESAADAVEVYRDWASTYDEDVFGALGFTGTERIADLLAEHLEDRTAAVLDLGCGTGAAGVRLRDHGFTTIDGVDVSPEMLTVAAETGVYRELIEADLNLPMPVADGTYDAAISAGTFTHGHVGREAVPGILPVLRPGAVVAWVIGDWTSFEPTTTGWSILHRANEPIRRGGPPEAVMLVARLS